MNRSDSANVVIFTKDGGITVGCAVAADEASRTRGLSNRRLAAGCGMLFVFGAAQNTSITTANTLEPLDIVFIDQSMKISAIVHNARPGAASPYSSPIPARAVLEVRGGFCRDHEVFPGDRIDIRPINPS